jgi:hypothetical protein
VLQQNKASKPVDPPQKRIAQRVMGRKEKSLSPDVALVDMVREFGGIADFVGGDYEVYDIHGEMQWTIRKRPLSVEQFNAFANALRKLRELEAKSMNSGNSKSPMARKR